MKSFMVYLVLTAMAAVGVSALYAKSGAPATAAAACCQGSPACCTPAAACCR